MLFILTIRPLRIENDPLQNEGGNRLCRLGLARKSGLATHNMTAIVKTGNLRNKYGLQLNPRWGINFLLHG